MNREILEQVNFLKFKEDEAVKRLEDEKETEDHYPDELQKVHHDNAIELDKLVEQYGWLNKTIVGDEGAKTAFFLAQHSICTPDVLRKLLVAIERSYNDGLTPKRHFVYLRDRVLHHENKPQICGWVFDWQPDGQLGCWVEDIAVANELRKEMELPSLEKHVEIHRASAEEQGKKLHSSYEEYKAASVAWHKQVGWY